MKCKVGPTGGSHRGECVNMITIIPIINQLPFPSKRRIEKSKRDVRVVIQRIIDDRKKGLTKSACKGFTFCFY
jgi:hypothetical protein